MEEGDEIVQVNYQTVVGWERKNVLELFRESPAEILLTLKRRPRHTKVYGQIYIKPYRLPSNKKTPYTSRWHHNLPSPRPELLTIPDFTMPQPRHAPKVPTPEPTSILDTVSLLDTMTTDDSSNSDSENEPPSSVRLYSAKPRNPVQRRATITGASPTAKHSVDIEHFWLQLKKEHSTTFQLRDKAASCAHGLDSVQNSPSRPQTCLGIEQRGKKASVKQFETGRKVQFQDERHAHGGKLDHITLNSDSCGKQTQRGVDSGNAGNNNSQPQAANKATASDESNNKSTDSNVHLEETQKQQGLSSSQPRDDKGPPTVPARSSANKERGRLDKSHSTPAYDLTESDDDFLEKKFEAALDEHHKQQQKSRAAAAVAALNGSNSSFNKTDLHLFDSTEDLEEPEKMLVENSTSNDREITRLVGNVAKRVNDIEKHIHNKSNENISKAHSGATTVKANVHIKINDIDVSDHLDELEVDSGNTTTDFDTDEENNSCSKEVESSSGILVSNESANSSVESSSRESSEDKSESISSYIEGGGTPSYSSDEIAQRNVSNVIGSTLRETDTCNGKEADDSYKRTTPTPTPEDSTLCEEKLASNNGNDQMIRALSPNIHVHKNALVENISAKYPTSPIPLPPVNLETPKKEIIPKPEVKPRLTPPEPPPRKYFTKPAPLNFSLPPQPIIDQDHFHHSISLLPEKPKVPDRPSVRRDLKKVDVPPEVHPRDEKTLSTENRHKSERFETYSDFVERSTDFIDEPGTPQNAAKAANSIVDQYGYTQIPEPNPREDTFIPNHPISNVAIFEQMQQKHERSLSIDSADGSCYSRQAQHNNVITPETKPRTLENKSHEKSMVNRAMMVARSMGLHGNLAKASSSPKSPRKRNASLAKRRHVGVKDVAPGDLEGWLTYRSRGAGGAWARAWFILKGASLYRFKLQDSAKADCLIALSGFTASSAAEVKSRKFAFKVYYTGTVFYFAADTEDTLALWLDAINKATLGADRTSGLFSETDESDGENKNKAKSPTSESKPLAEKTFGSLKKFGRKDSNSKDQDISGASLDRKYLKFLGSRTQNVPVPTAQFRSYRRVLPTSTPNRKVEKMSSPDLQVTIAGSTFYGLNASHSATDVPTSSQDMGDYRRTAERSRGNRHQRPDELHGFITLEEFMLARQEEECQRIANNNSNNATRFTPLNNDHVHFQHRNIAESPINSVVQNNGMIYGSPRNGDDDLPPAPPPPNPTRGDAHASNHSFDSEAISNNSRNETTKPKTYKKPWEPSCLQKKSPSDSNNYEAQQPCVPTASSRDLPYTVNVINDVHTGFSTLDYGERLKPQPWTRHVESNPSTEFQHTTRRDLRNEGHSGSSGDLVYQPSSETMQRVIKETNIGRNGSFNLADRRRLDHVHPERNWIDSFRSTDKRSFTVDKGRFNNVAQCQPMSTSTFESDNMRLAYERYLDKANDQQKKTSTKGLRNFFGTRSPQKPGSLDLPREQQKTLLGSPRLHRAIFGDKSSQRKNSRSGSQSPRDSGTSQALGPYTGPNQFSTFNQTFSSVNSNSDWSTDTPTFHGPNCMFSGVAQCQKRPRHLMAPPTLPYIPPPTSPPPDYPGLEYPPVFEPGTYSLSDTSFLQHGDSKNCMQNTSE